MATTRARLNTLLLVLVLLALMALLAMQAADVRSGPLDPLDPPGSTMLTLDEIEPRTPISALPYAINEPGSYYLTANLSLAEPVAVGIDIVVDGVVLDLNGFTLDGMDVSGTGVRVAPGATGTTIRNGTVTRWNLNGIDAQNGGLIEDIHAIDNNAVGILLRGTLRRCSAVGNSGIGILSYYGTVIDCFSQGNGTGFSLTESTLSQCSALSNQTGVLAQGSVVQACIVNFNFVGISVTGASKSAGGSMVKGNAIRASGADGIAVSGWNSVIADNVITNSGATQAASGIYVTGQRNRIEGNHVNDTIGYGILVNIGSGNLIVRNWADANTTDYFFGPANDAGPIQLAGTSTSPWANLTH